ncbi:RagB/SusD family nutrient uptake outer membrane protein [Niabella yanshanensis]|uniref:RagB/SusD family nutrient uptake outer membrane protein n=1 Tax=Niabella yanshanensis TaxID=577386 RepID=A0ABZ0W2U5_9BACT|nr:RagB/SusD family nutrient uptake outer membrane protein [Niabella yanshanensis]WQD37039.1 RagB/SusD family nutrient uptake outer membrane protein [Niabella yanshanensis]
MLLTLCWIVSMSSCKKILEQQPQNSTYDEVFWQTARDCEFAIAGNYSLLRASFTATSSYEENAFRYNMYGDAQTSSTSYLTINYNGDGLEGIQGGDFTFQYNLQTLGDWTVFYKTIAYSNIILKKIPLIADDKLAKDVVNVVTFKNKIMGQALFIRALSYFQLVKVWGDVPIVTEAYDDVLNAPQLPRSPKAEVMKQIENDCHAAINMLNWGNEAIQEKGVIANRGSVYALLAHLYLWRATMSNVNNDTPIMSDVNSADTTLNTLIARGGYSLADTAKYGDQFITPSTESIFEVAMSENYQEGAYYHIGLGFLTGTYVQGYSSTPRFWVPDQYIDNHYGVEKTGYGEGWVYWPTDWKVYTMRVTGTRYYVTIDGVETEVTDYVDGSMPPGFAYVGDDLVQVGGNGPDLGEVRYRNNFAKSGTQGTNLIKYRNIIYRNPGNRTNGYLSNNIPVFRLSDMRLLQAEVALYKNDLSTAAQIINFFRDRNNSSSARVSATDSKFNLTREYMLERGKELYMEGHVYFDLLRTRMYAEFISWMSTTRFKGEGFYWPIYPLLFNDNKFLTQTLYWRGKV